MESDSASHAPFGRTATSRDAPNPLRPYYVPPSIGLPPDTASSANGRAPPNPYSFKPALGPTGTSSNHDFRELFSDIDYEGYLGEKSEGVGELAKKIVDQAIWNYASTFLAQPFEVAKIVLQCHEAGAHTMETLPTTPSTNRKRWQNGYEDGRYADYFDDDEESDSDLPSYFTPTAPRETPSSQHDHRRRRPPSRSHSATPTPASTHLHAHRIELRRSDSVFEVLSQLWTKESAWGVWKGTNATFVYNVLLKTIETWTRSLLSALLNLPDPTLISSSSVPASLGNVSIIDSPRPIATLGVAIAAAGIAGIILAPLDMARTRLIVTPTTYPPRALIPSLRSLPSLTIPPKLIPATLLHSTLPSLLSTSAPLFLRTTFRIDPVLTPATYSLSTFLVSLGELFVRLPLETVLRRGHVAVLSTQSQSRQGPHSGIRSPGLPTVEPSSHQPHAFQTVVPVGPYRGVWGTMWYIIREEGTSSSPVAALKTATQRQKDSFQRKPVTRKGQGVRGLWRGWRVGFWGLVGVWGAAALGGGGSGGEF